MVFSRKDGDFHGQFVKFQGSMRFQKIPQVCRLCPVPPVPAFNWCFSMPDGQTKAFGDVDTPQIERNKNPPWEPKTFIFRGYDPYVWGPKTFIFHGFGVQRRKAWVAFKTISLPYGSKYLLRRYFDTLPPKLYPFRAFLAAIWVHRVISLYG